MVRSCALDLGVISAEIELLQPTHIVFYTGKLFPDILEVLPIEGKRAWRDIEKSTVKCGQKKLSWWEREITTSWGNMRVLITGHPERMEKVSYTQMIAGWARQSGSLSASAHVRR